VTGLPWTVRSRVFLFGGEVLKELVRRFPAHIFGKWFLRLTSTLLPFAFGNYFPTLIPSVAGDPHQLWCWLRCG
jgi:hypothetical protein